MSERVASKVLLIVYRDLDADRQRLMKLQATLDEGGSAVEAQADRFIAVLGELDPRPEVTRILREMIDGNRGLHATVGEWLSGALTDVERRQKMIRDQGFGPDA